MAKTWMEASGSGRESRPAFIVNKEGKIAWIGHPMEMERPLEKIVAGHWDLKSAAEEIRKQQPPTEEEAEALARLAKNYKIARQEDDSEKMITAIDALLGHKPDLAEKLGPVEVRTPHEARPAGTGTGIRPVTRAEAPLGEEPGGLNTIAWGIVATRTAIARPKGELLKLALAIATRADVGTDHRNAEIADTLGIEQLRNQATR